MKYMKVLAAFLVGVLLAAADVHALTFGLDTAYVTPAVTPDGIPPWLTATFEDVGPNSVRLTMSANNLSGTTQSVGQWFFNFSEATSLLRTSFTYHSGDQASITKVAQLAQSRGRRFFDIEFEFAAGQFTPGEKSIYLISGGDPNNPISSESFNFRSISDPIQDANYYSAALVNGITAGSGVGSLHQPHRNLVRRRPRASQHADAGHWFDRSGVLRRKKF